MLGDEFHYLRSVLRVQPGTVVRVFNGTGAEWAANVIIVDRDSAEVLLTHVHARVPESAFPVTLALSVLKSEFMDAAIRDGVMLGASAVQPVLCERSQGSRREDWSVVSRRWSRIALAAARQSGRAVLPPVAEPLPLESWLDQQSSTAAVRLVLAEPALESRGVVDLDAWRPAALRAGVTLLVGPEGGWTAREFGLATAAGFQPWTINSRVLRADAVPVAALSILFFLWDRPEEGPSGGPA